MSEVTLYSVVRSWRFSHVSLARGMAAARVGWGTPEGVTRSSGHAPTVKWSDAPRTSPIVGLYDGVDRPPG